MFIILLISSALGACTDHDDVDECLAENKCVWTYDHAEQKDVCEELTCAKIPIRGLCEKEAYCEWTDGKCAIVNCLRYPAAKCPTDKGCKKLPETGPNSGCFPGSMDPKDDDKCTRIYKSNQCKFNLECDWKNDKCVKDSCFKSITEESECDTSKCKVFTENGAANDRKYCVKKIFDPANELCFIYSAGAECDSSFVCMTDGTKCKPDDCLDFTGTKTSCEDQTGCKWGMPDLLKDVTPGDNMCYHKDHVFSAGTLGVLPALMQNKIFQLASALLLFLLV